ncbi:MAG: hypothetical protein ACM3ZD_03810 [Betaproteobacteria bacterium]
MSLDEALRIASLCVVLAGVETLHGIARTVWLAPRVGKARAIKLSVVSGTLLAFGVCWLLVPGIGLHGLGPHLALGLGIAAFMAAFDVFIGRVVMRFDWPRIGRDFDPASGNYLSVGLVLLVFTPGLVWWLQTGGMP